MVFLGLLLGLQTYKINIEKLDLQQKICKEVFTKKTEKTLQSTLCLDKKNNFRLRLFE